MKARNRDMAVVVDTKTGEVVGHPARLPVVTRARLAGRAVVAGASLRSRAAAATAQPVPAPAIAAPSYLLLDVTSGQSIVAENADERREPASLTKLMTAYLAFAALARQGDRAGADGRPCPRPRGVPRGRGCSSSRARRSPSTSCCAG